MSTAIPVPTFKHGSEDKEKEAMCFKNTCSLFFKGSLKSLNEDERLTYVLLWLGPDFSEIYKTWEPSTDSKLYVLDAVGECFSSICSGCRDVLQ